MQTAIATALVSLTAGTVQAATPSMPAPLNTAKTIQVTEKFYLLDDNGQRYLHQILHVKVAGPDHIWIEGIKQPAYASSPNAMKPVYYISDGHKQWQYRGATNQYSITDGVAPGAFRDQLVIANYQALLDVMSVPGYDNTDPKGLRTTSVDTFEGKTLRVTTTQQPKSESLTRYWVDAKSGLPYRFCAYSTQNGKDTLSFRLDFSDWKLNEPIPNKQFSWTPPAGAILYTPPARLAPGQTAPDFTAMTTDGKPVRLSDYRGKVVVLDFWATWDARSQASLDALESIHKQGKDKDLVVLAICVWDGKDSFLRWAGTSAGSKYTFPIVCDPAGVDGNRSIALSLYNMPGVPTRFVIDKAGAIVTMNSGSRPPGLKDDLPDILAKQGVKLGG